MYFPKSWKWLTSTATFGTCLHVGTMFQKLIHDSYMATIGSQM
jgi:hypothetical protein